MGTVGGSGTQGVPSLIRGFIALLSMDIRNWVAGLRHSSPGQKLRGVLFLLLLIAFVVAAEYLSFRLFNAFLKVGDMTISLISLLLFIRMLGLLFLIVTGLLYFGSLIAAVSLLFDHPDIDFLVSLPIPRTAILLKKLVLLYLSTSWVAFLVLFPVMLGYSRATGHSPLHLPATLGALAFFCLIPIAAGGSTVILLMRFLPVDRAREMVLTLGALLSLSLVSFYRLLSPSRLFLPSKMIEDFTKFLKEFSLPISEFSPSNLMTRAMMAATGGDWNIFLENAGLLFFAGTVLTVFYLFLGKYIYKTDRPVSGAVAKPGFFERILHVNSIARSLSRISKPGTRQLFYREIMTNFRDPMQISHLILLVAIVVLHFMNLTEIPAFIHPGARVLLAFLNFGLVGFVTAGVAGRFIYPAVSLEGNPFWLIETAPLSHADYFKIKFIVTWFPLLLLSSLILIVSNIIIDVPYPLTLLWLVYSIHLVTLVSVLALTLGILIPEFRKENVFEISSSPGGIFFMLLSLLFVLITIVLLAPLTYRYIIERFPLLDLRSIGLTVTYSLTTLTAMVFSVRLSLTGLRRLPETRRFAIKFSSLERNNNEP